MTFPRGYLAAVSLFVAFVAALLVSALPVQAQAPMQLDRYGRLRPVTLLQMYKYAFHAYARDDAQAAELEYKGESALPFAIFCVCNSS